MCDRVKIVDLLRTKAIGKMKKVENEGASSSRARGKEQ